MSIDFNPSLTSLDGGVLDASAVAGTMPRDASPRVLQDSPKERAEQRLVVDALATALQDDVPFRNCIVNGMILAEDGRKMSKSLRNFPDPMGVLEEFGADALRAFLVNSPVMRAEPPRLAPVTLMVPASGW